jgi:hypothetical protein
MVNTMWSALLLICAIDSDGEFKEERQCTAIVSQQVWRNEESCMNGIAQGFNSQLQMPTSRAFSIRDFACFEWERQRHVTPDGDDSKL